MKNRVSGFSITSDTSDVAAFMTALNESSIHRVPYSAVDYWNLFLNETFPEFYLPKALLSIGVPIWTNQDSPLVMSARNDAVNSRNSAVPSSGSFDIRLFGYNFALEFRSVKVGLMPSS